MDSKRDDRGREAKRTRPSKLGEQTQLFAAKASGVEVVSDACGANRFNDIKQARIVGDL